MSNPFQQHGAFSWCELMTSDVEAAKTFYSKLFGWGTEDMKQPGMDYTVVKVEGNGIGGIMEIPKDAKGTPPAWNTYVTVNDVDRTARLAEQLGAKLCVQPSDIPGVGRFCVIQDPQGATINVITYSKM